MCLGVKTITQQREIPLDNIREKSGGHEPENTASKRKTLVPRTSLSGIAGKRSRHLLEENARKWHQAVLKWISKTKRRSVPGGKSSETNSMDIRMPFLKSDEPSPSTVPSPASYAFSRSSVPPARLNRSARWLGCPPSQRHLGLDTLATRGSFSSGQTSNEPTSLDQESIATYERYHLRCETEGLSLLGPQPFQCTFCFLQCTSRREWLEHEFHTHYQGQEWDRTTKIVGPGRLSNRPFLPIFETERGRNTWDKPSVFSQAYGSSSGYVKEPNQRHPQPQEDWFWNCGFCDTILRSWSERQYHIHDAHYEEGTTMRAWDPVKSPYPWKRGSISRVPTEVKAGCWDLLALQAMQEPTLIDLIERTGGDTHICNAPQHTNLWHGVRTGWSCSRLPRDPEALKDLFFNTYTGRNGSTVYICLCCDEALRRGGPDDENNNDNDNDADDRRLEHLRRKHKFYDGEVEGSCRHTCYSTEQFCLHLANRHNLLFDSVKEVMGYCRGEPTAVVAFMATGIV